MIILGVDPGTIKTGYGIIMSSPKGVIPVAYGTLQLKKFETLPLKMKQIYSELNSLIIQYTPAILVIETAFYGKNVQSALKIGYARGAAILAGIHQDIEIFEYSPKEIKKAVVGSGAASKEQVNYMVKAILELKSKKLGFDESDALAGALCHAYRNRIPSKGKQSWKSFIDNNPQVVIQ